MYKFVIIAGYAVSCIGTRIISNDNIQAFLIIIVIHLVLSLLTMLCYFTFGFNVYRHSTPRVLMIGTIVVYSSLSLSLLFD